MDICIYIGTNNVLFKFALLILLSYAEECEGIWILTMDSARIHGHVYFSLRLDLSNVAKVFFLSWDQLHGHKTYFRQIPTNFRQFSLLLCQV